MNPRRSAYRVSIRYRSPAQIAGLVAARARTDLDDHVLLVVRVALDHREPDLLLELGEPRLRGREQLARLRVLPLGEQLARALGVARRAPPLLRELVRRLERVVLAPDLRVPLAVRDHLGVRHLPLEIREAALYLADEVAQATTSIPTLSSSEASAGFSTARTASSAAIATASWERSGSRVVSF